jgi:hypothetical protein
MRQSSNIAPVSERSGEEHPRTRNSTSRFNWHSLPGFPRHRFLGAAVSSRRGFVVGPSSPRGSTEVSVGSTPTMAWTFVCSIIEVRERGGFDASPLLLTARQPPVVPHLNDSFAESLSERVLMLTMRRTFPISPQGTPSKLYKDPLSREETSLAYSTEPRQTTNASW